MITLSAKDPAEVISLSADYAELLAVGETLASATLALTVLHGADASVGAMPVGSAVISGSIVSHLVRNGMANADYTITILAITSLGQTIKMSGVLPVRVQS